MRLAGRESGAHGNDGRESHAHRQAADRTFHRRPAPPKGSLGFGFSRSQLTVEGPRHQADIRAAGATVTCALNIFSCALGTEHRIGSSET